MFTNCKTDFIQHVKNAKDKVLNIAANKVCTTILNEKIIHGTFELFNLISTIFPEHSIVEECKELINHLYPYIIYNITFLDENDRINYCNFIQLCIAHHGIIKANLQISKIINNMKQLISYINMYFKNGLNPQYLFKFLVNLIKILCNDALSDDESTLKQIETFKKNLTEIDNQAQLPEQV